MTEPIPDASFCVTQLSLFSCLIRVIVLTTAVTLCPFLHASHSAKSSSSTKIGHAIPRIRQPPINCYPADPTPIHQSTVQKAWGCHPFPLPLLHFKLVINAKDQSTNYSVHGRSGLGHTFSLGAEPGPPLPADHSVTEPPPPLPETIPLLAALPTKPSLPARPSPAASLLAKLSHPPPSATLSAIPFLIPSEIHLAKPSSMHTIDVAISNISVLMVMSEWPSAQSTVMVLWCLNCRRTNDGL